MTDVQPSPAAADPPSHAIDWAGALTRLRHEDHVWASVQGEQVAWLAPPPGGVVIEVGCGAGGMSLRLAAAVGGDGTVIAVDGEPALAASTADAAAERGIPLAVRTMDLSAAMPADLVGSADLVVARSVVHHLPDEAAAVASLASLLRPGGRLAIGEGGLPLRLLPFDVGIGRPGLEARIEVARNRWFEGHRHSLTRPVARPGGWTEVLRAAGLADIVSKTFLLDHPAPVEDPVRAAVVSWLAWLREPDRMRYVEEEDRRAVEVLLDPDDDRSLARRPDLAVLAAASLHTGVRG